MDEISSAAAPRRFTGQVCAFSPNRLIAALPLEAQRRLIGHTTQVSLRRRQVIQDRNLPLASGYFIEKGAASLVARTGGRSTVEIRALGSWDFVGIPLLLGTRHSPHRCIVQIPGEARQITASGLAAAMDTIPELRPLLLAYVHAALTHSSQLAVCGALHSVEQRVARSLLALADQIGADELPLTHEALSKAIGVRRASVTSAVGGLEGAGLVERRRGTIRITQREGLEQVCCGCYRAIRSAHERMLSTAREVSARDVRAIDTGLTKAEESRSNGAAHSTGLVDAGSAGVRPPVAGEAG